MLLVVWKLGCPNGRVLIKNAVRASYFLSSGIHTKKGINTDPSITILYASKEHVQGITVNFPKCGIDLTVIWEGSPHHPVYQRDKAVLQVVEGGGIVC